MLTLRDLQTGFCRSMTGDTPEELMQLISGDGLEPSARLSIYRNNVVTRLTDTLAAIYPVVQQLVHPRFFAYAADAFIRRYLPREACLTEYGAEFAAFLMHFPPVAHLPYLPDVARLEWIIDRVVRVAPHSPVSIAALVEAEGDPADIRLRLAPSIRFLASPYRIDQVWKAHQRDETFPALQIGDSGVRLQIAGGKGLHIVSLPAATWEFRAQLARGETLGIAFASATAVSTSFDLTPALADLFNEGLVVGMNTGPGNLVSPSPLECPTAAGHCYE